MVPVRGYRELVPFSMEMDKILRAWIDSERTCGGRSSSTQAGDNSNLSILNNGGEAESKQDGEDELRAAWAQSIEASRAVS